LFGAESTIHGHEGHRTTIRLLQLLAAGSLLVPAIIFAVASWIGLGETEALADERIRRSLDVMQEQTFKVFQSMNLGLTAIDQLLGSRSPDDMQRDEPTLHAGLRKIADALPDVQSIWIFGPDGRPQVITRESPPPTLFYGDQDYFTVPRNHPDTVYIGTIHDSVSGNDPYFSFDRGRRDSSGRFAGVIEMSLRPSVFRDFYAQLVSSPGLRFALLREDGTVLAQLPADAVSAPDNTGVRIGERRLPNLPLVVRASYVQEQVYEEWMQAMGRHLIFGLPATLFMFLLMLTVLRRTRRLYAEIDQRHAAEESLRQAQRLDAIGHLTGGIAHDFNNLLTIILGNLDYAKQQVGEWSDAAHLKLSRRIENAMHGATRAATLTKRLLAFARQTPLNPVGLDPNRLLRGMSEFLQRALGEDIALEIVGAAGLWAVEADATELEAALLNLAVNARDAMPGGGKLTLETSNAYLDDAYCRPLSDVRPGQYVMIAVSDTGTGMSKEVVNRAFEPFFTTKTAGQGTGLGLSQVYGFAKQSGGHARIYSEPSEGTTVKIYLPRAAGIVETASDAPIETRRGQPGECVLVVEDDADVRSFVVETLRGLGYDVLEAGNAEDALALLDRYTTIQLLLTDVVMPGKNGRKLAEEACARLPSLKVLYMTGYSRNAIVHQGRLDSGVDLIQKPVTGMELAAAVRGVLDG
jgi:signal transduction histidine kinase/CheY-like chemotaxis protein